MSTVTVRDGTTIYYKDWAMARHIRIMSAHQLAFLKKD
jgi:hypothetical protein